MEIEINVFIGVSFGTPLLDLAFVGSMDTDRVT